MPCDTCHLAKAVLRGAAKVDAYLESTTTLVVFNVCGFRSCVRERRRPGTGLHGPSLGWRREASLRRFFARLLRGHVLGIPIWPVRVALPTHAFFMLPVGGLSSAQRACQVAHRREGSGIDAPWQP